MMNQRDLLKQGNFKAIARMISLVENEGEGYEELLMTLTGSSTKITGITGSPGAGKSTLVDKLIEEFIKDGTKVAVLCVDPSSPFHKGALLGDRVRMSKWYNNPLVYIRSLATRGSLGGLHPKIIEITDVLSNADFKHIIVETVGVGQTEVEIAALADTTVVVFVPEAGDEIQTMKAGLMEIADIFVVNKSDRPGADMFVKNLNVIVRSGSHQHEIPILKTIASEGKHIDELHQLITSHQNRLISSEKRYELLAEKAFYLLQHQRMKDINKDMLKQEIEELADKGNFNLYKFVSEREKRV